MSLKLGSTDVSGLYLGSTAINKVYLGSTEVFTTAGGSTIASHPTLTTGLVSYWGFNQSSGVLFDSHGSNDATNNGGTYGATGKIGTAIDLDGVNDYIETDIASSTIGTDISLSCWIKPNSSSDLQNIFSDWSTERSILVRIFSNQIQFFTGDGSSTISGSASTAFTNTSTFTHLGISYNAATRTGKIYINGSLADTNVWGTVRGSSVSTTLAFGKGDWFEGIIDEPSIWSKTLTDSEFSDLYNSGSALPFDGSTISSHSSLTTGLVSYQNFNTNANDLVGSNNGTVSGATLTTGSGGIMGEAYDLDGVNDTITYGSNFKFNYNEPFSHSFWVNPDNVTSGVLFSDLDSGTGFRGFEVRIESGKLRVFFVNNFGSNAIDATTASSILSTGTYQHVVITYDGSGTAAGFTVYVDNVSYNFTSVSQDTLSATTVSGVTFRVGARVSATYYNGKIDEWGVYSKAVTGLEVSDLYNSGSGLPYN